MTCFGMISVCKRKSQLFVCQGNSKEGLDLGQHPGHPRQLWRLIVNCIRHYYANTIHFIYHYTKPSLIFTFVNALLRIYSINKSLKSCLAILQFLQFLQVQIRLQSRYYLIHSQHTTMQCISNPLQS